MKILIKTSSVIILILLTLSLFACDFDESKNNLSGGMLLNDEKMSQIKQEILSGEETESESENIVSSTESEDTSDSGNASNKIVYWSITGSVWHESISCSHINNNPDIMAGTVNQAIEAKKTKPCSRCCE